MTEEARVRISKITPKAGGAVVSILPTRPDPDDSNFIPTLVWALEQARRGKVVAYAAVFSVENADGSHRCFEMAKACDDGDRHHMLGLIRRLEHGYIKRTWGDEE